MKGVLSRWRMAASSSFSLSAQTSSPSPFKHTHTQTYTPVGRVEQVAHGGQQRSPCPNLSPIL
eukprot:1158893-Pelagomonas_calceolata.AAC.28